MIANTQQRSVSLGMQSTAIGIAGSTAMGIDGSDRNRWDAQNTTAIGIAGAHRIRQRSESLTAIGIAGAKYVSDRNRWKPNAQRSRSLKIYI
jgi:hypothetical protein